MIGIVDYGLGNIHSVVNSLEYLGLETLILNNKTNIDKIDRVILPGVGAFAKAMANIAERDLFDVINRVVERRYPVLGICLGMQILATKGFEVTEYKGLGLIEGTVDLIKCPESYRLPHVGWNSLDIIQEHPILENISRATDFYFVHSYAFEPATSKNVIATTDYGVKVPAIVGDGNIIGVQFHPEKSQKAGLKLLSNFSKWKVHD